MLGVLSVSSSFNLNSLIEKSLTSSATRQRFLNPSLPKKPSYTTKPLKYNLPNPTKGSKPWSSIMAYKSKHAH